MAAAALVLGGACGGDDEKKTADAPSAEEQRRLAAVADALCRYFVTCGIGNETESSLAECSTFYVETLTRDAQGDADCLDALLDYYACYAELDCTLSSDEADRALGACELTSSVSSRCRARIPAGES